MGGDWACVGGAVWVVSGAIWIVIRHVWPVQYGWWLGVCGWCSMGGGWGRRYQLPARFNYAEYLHQVSMDYLLAVHRLLTA